MGYEVFSRPSWRKVGGRFVPYPGARRTRICHCETVEEARKICAEGPANMALSAGKEYRHLSFYEFTEE